MPELWQKVKEEYLSEVNPPWLDKDKLIKFVDDSLNKHETTPSDMEDHKLFCLVKTK